MKKYIKIISLFILIISLFININGVYAKDVSSGFSITSARFCNDTDCSIEYDENNGIVGKEKFLIIFNWKYQGESLENGDTISVPFGNDANTETTTLWSSATFSWIDLLDQNNNVIGKVRLVYDDVRKKLEIKLTNVNGVSSISGSVTTSKNFFSNYSYKDIVVPVTMHNYVKKIKILKNSFNEGATKKILYTTTTGDNARIGFTIISPYYIPHILYNYDENNSFPNNGYYKNIVCEQYIPAGSSYSHINIWARTNLPTNIEEHNNSSSISESAMYNNKFNVVTQLENETYEEFKNRLKKNEYGVYKDDVNREILVMNLGNLPNEDIKYSEIFGMQPGEYVHNKNSFTNNSELISIYNNAYGDNNLVNGSLAQFMTNTIVDFPPVLIDTDVTSTAICTWDDYQGNTKQLTGEQNGKLTPATAISVTRGDLKLIKVDSESNLAISGAEFKLQKKNGNSWVDIKSNLKTDESGLISLSNLDDGEYKFVETTYVNHYKNNSFKMYSDSKFNNLISSVTLSGNGKVVYATNEREDIIIKFKPGTKGEFEEVTLNLKYGDNIIIPSSLPNVGDKTSTNWEFTGWDESVATSATENKIYTAKWEKKVKLIEHYYVEGTTTKVKNDKSTTVNVGSNYSVTRDDSGIASKYVYVSTTGNTSGTVPDGNVEIKYYYKLKPATVTTRHLEDGTNTKLAEDVIQNKKYDDAYTTTVASSIGQNYENIRTSGDNKSGTISKDSYEVIYYYKKKESQIDNNVNKTTTNIDITSKEDVVNYTITNTINITDYIGNGTVTITDTLPYEIDLDKSNLNGGTYNNDNKIITWNENWNGIDSFNNKGNKTITKNISLVFKNIDSKQRIMSNEVSSNIVLDNKSSTNNTHVDNNIKIKGKVIIKYLDEDDNELSNTIEEENLVGEIVSSEVLEFEGYDLINKPESEVHEIKDEITEVVYRYKKRVFNIEVEAGSGGKATGAGSIKYGEDSNNIVVTADEGYCIDKIIVDGKEISVVNCKSQTIDKFTNVTGSHKVKVTFKKNVISTNPLTGSLLKIATLIILIGISAILIINNKRLIKN